MQLKSFFRKEVNAMEYFNPARLRRARRRQRLTTAQAGKIIGRDRSAIWRYESGLTDIPVSVMLKLVNAYKISVVELFDAGKIGGRNHDSI